MAGVDVAHDTEAFSENGVVGDPDPGPGEGDAATGERLLSTAAETLATVLAAVGRREEAD